MRLNITVHSARNFAALKFVTKGSQWRKMERGCEEGAVGERSTCGVYHSQPIQSARKANFCAVRINTAPAINLLGCHSPACTLPVGSL
ncbi:hypothetical protein EVAR_92955_1 [Eumeta japonica]|uniref:Uncharacterized protein n=1 Tax=Eumeta variegata TaxID=151549 RepID=A0A4C1TDD2_EUMVA|nr:hypothetical protein EVAR_92955_1 [Eumeta japonica]